jgi:hypothetical protein
MLVRCLRNGRVGRWAGRGLEQGDGGKEAMKIRTTFAAVAVLSGVLSCGCRRVQTTDLVAGTNSVVWADKAIGSTVCGDGQTRPVRFGFRDDGSVVWRIEDNHWCFNATNKAMEKKEGEK